jgi:hypothetical protein
MRIWDSHRGGFSLSKAYLLACNSFTDCNSLKPSSWIWKVRTSLRILFFLWQCYHLSVPMRDTLSSCGLNILTFCPRCLGPSETLIHLLRDCPDSISFWQAFQSPSLCNQFYFASLFDRLHSNCNANFT